MLNNSQSYNDVWQTCLTKIREKTSEDEFVKWFKPIVPLNFDGTTLQLRVPSESYVYHIEKNYIPFLRPVIREMFGLQTKLRYAVPKSDHQPAAVSSDADITAITRFAEATDTANIKNPFIILPF